MLLLLSVLHVTGAIHFFLSNKGKAYRMAFRWCRNRMKALIKGGNLVRINSKQKYEEVLGFLVDWMRDENKTQTYFWTDMVFDKYAEVSAIPEPE